MPDDITPTPDTQTAPQVRSTSGAGMPKEEAVPAGDDSSEAPANPKTSGASAKDAGVSKSRTADRNTSGPREEGATPRPTNKPV